MKKKFTRILGVALAVACVSLFTIPAFANSWTDNTPDYPVAPPVVGLEDADEDDVLGYFCEYYYFGECGWFQRHEEFSGTSCTDYCHENDCIHRRTWSLILEDDYHSFEELSAMLTSGDWARRGILKLLDTLPQAANWTLESYVIHEESDNGWTELRLRNSYTGEVLECVMNAYTTKSFRDDDGYRYFAFTWEECDADDIEDCDDDELITAPWQSKDVAIAEFVSKLINGTYSISPGYVD